MLLAITMASIVLTGSWLPAVADMVNEEEKCLHETAEYVAGIEISDSVKMLVTESRKTYPDGLLLMKAQNYSDELTQSLNEIGSQESCLKDCLKIRDHFVNINTCFRKMGDDEESYVKLMQVSTQAKEAVEAHLLCEIASPDMPWNQPQVPVKL